MRTTKTTSQRGIVHTHMAVVRCGDDTKMCKIFDEYDTVLNVATGRKIALWGDRLNTYYYIDEQYVCQSIAASC